jgi:hypothetical protein
LKNFFFFWKKSIDKPWGMCYNDSVRIPFLVLRGKLMNRSCADFEQYYSKIGIMPILSAEASAPIITDKKAGFCVSRAASALRRLTSSAVRRWAKVAGFAISLVALLGIAGAIEFGKISLFGGVALSALTLGIEYLCLREKKN